MMMTKLTKEQIEAVDKAVLAAIVNLPQAPRAADLLRVPAIDKIIGALPRRKAAFRYLDNSLQRLRRRCCIRATSGGRWHVIRDKP